MFETAVTPSSIGGGERIFSYSRSSAGTVGNPETFSSYQSGHASAHRNSPPVTVPDTLPPPAFLNKVSKPQHSSQFWQLTETIAWITIFSIIGTLTRVGLTNLTNSSDSLLGGVIWANFTGCVLMGFLVADNILRSVNVKHPLYLGLTSGLCGSITSFSSFALSVFVYLTSGDSAASGIRAMAADVISTAALSLGGLQFGKHLAAGIEKTVSPVSKSISRPLHIAGYLAILFAIMVWAGVGIWIGIGGHGELLAWACVFSPPGAIMRFWTSRWLNARRGQWWPWGTLMVNIAATGVLGAMTVAAGSIHRHSPGEGDSTLNRMLLAIYGGISDGFCGCLSTISTLAVEVNNLGNRRAYWYSSVSLVTAVVLLVVVVGTWMWTLDDVSLVMGKL